MKTYNTPSLFAHGSLIATTATMGDGMGDPIAPPILKWQALGSIGFGL